jgi:hypothetical protein
MGSVKILEIKDQKVVLIDLCNAELPELVRVVQLAKEMIQAQPPESVMTLTDVTGAQATPAATRVLKEFVAGNRPFVKAAALVGVSGVMKSIYAAVMIFSNRKIPVFQDREKALQWLLTR